jgi:hypothetical protein
MRCVCTGTAGSIHDGVFVWWQVKLLRYYSTKTRFINAHKIAPGPISMLRCERKPAGLGLFDVNDWLIVIA